MASLTDMAGSKEDDCCDLGFKTRMIMGIISTVVSCVFTFLSFIPFAKKQMPTFAVIYIIGAIGSILSSAFFAGPKKHLAALKKIPHLISAICLILCFVLVLGIGIGTGNTAATVIFVVLQWVAMGFYFITLTDLGFKAIKTMFSALCA